jgi:hypothetical protein
VRYLFLSLILIGWVQSVGAQQTKGRLVPTPADDYFPQRWKEFRSAGQYRVLFPGIPKESTSTVTSAAGNVMVHRVSYESFISYTVMSTRYPAEVESLSTIKAFMDQLRDASLAAVAEAHPRIVRESDVSLDGHPGRFIQVELANNSVIRFKWIAVRNRVYFLYITTPKGHRTGGEAENDYEKIALSFIDSFQLLPRTET